MSLSVRVLASSASGSRASRRKYGDFTRAASTRLARCRSVIASGASGSRPGSQSRWGRAGAGEGGGVPRGRRRGGGGREPRQPVELGAGERGGRRVGRRRQDAIGHVG